MIQKYLLGSRKLIDTKGRDMDLQYYLVENTREMAGRSKLYGIQITKRIEIQGVAQIEIENTPYLSYSKEFVKSITFKLMEGEVTPLNLLNTTDDLIGEAMIRV